LGRTPAATTQNDCTAKVIRSIKFRINKQPAFFSARCIDDIVLLEYKPKIIYY